MKVRAYFADPQSPIKNESEQGSCHSIVMAATYIVITMRLDNHQGILATILFVNLNMIN